MASVETRGIPFLLTFDQWLKIWVDSGHLDKRGCSVGCYCMARNGDTGAYELGNVSIVPVQKNMSDATRGKKKPPMSATQKIKLSLALVGRPSYVRTEETKRKNAVSRLGQRWTLEQRERVSANWHEKRGLSKCS